MTHPMTIAEIADSLSEAQRRAILYRHEYGPTFSTICAVHPRTMDVLERLGLLSERCRAWAYLNGTGLAVRAHLGMQVRAHLKEQEHG